MERQHEILDGSLRQFCLSGARRIHAGIQTNRDGALTPRGDQYQVDQHLCGVVSQYVLLNLLTNYWTIVQAPLMGFPNVRNGASNITDVNGTLYQSTKVHLTVNKFRYSYRFTSPFCILVDSSDPRLEDLLNTDGDQFKRSFQDLKMIIERTHRA